MTEDATPWASMGQGVSAPVDTDQQIRITQESGMSENVFFGGAHDLPFRGKSAQPPMLKNDETDKLTEVWDCRVRVFNTGNKDDMQVYTKICDSVAKRICEISVEERQWIPEKQEWKIFLRWIEKYVEQPNQWKSGVAFDHGHIQLD